MNWLDVALIGLVILGALRGFRIGLLGAAVNVFALILGWLLASQIVYALGLAISKSEWTGSILVVAVFTLVIAATVAAVQFAWRIARTTLGVATLGVASLVDRLGGLLLGVILGGVLAGALVLGLARLTHEMPKLAWLERSLAESAVVGAFIEETEGLPLNGFGFIPPEFAESLEWLGSRN